jgi:hypothetical protein
MNINEDGSKAPIERPAMPSIVDHDQLFKRLLRTFFKEFIELFLPEVHAYLDPGSITFLDKEFFTSAKPAQRKDSRRVADLVVKCKFKGRRSCFLIHIEPESSRREKRGEFGRRMLRYLGLLTAAERLPVYPIAILSYDSPRDPESDTFRIEFPDKVVLVFHFTIIQLNRLKWRDFLRHDNPVASALMAKMGFAESERVEVKLECLNMIARLRLDRERAGLLADFVDAYLKLSDEEHNRLQAKIEDLPDSEREVTMEFTNRWYTDGWQHGVQEGLQEGLQHMRSLVLRQLELQIGALSKRSQTSIKRLSIEQLELLGETLIKFANSRDLARWLRDHAPANDKPNGHPVQSNGRKTQSRTSA